MPCDSNVSNCIITCARVNRERLTGLLEQIKKINHLMCGSWKDKLNDVVHQLNSDLESVLSHSTCLIGKIETEIHALEAILFPLRAIIQDQVESVCIPEGNKTDYTDYTNYISMLTRAGIPFSLSDMGKACQDGPGRPGNVGVVAEPINATFYTVVEFDKNGVLCDVGAFEG